jgi:hypothetical protein
VFASVARGGLLILSVNMRSSYGEAVSLIGKVETPVSTSFILLSQKAEAMGDSKASKVESGGETGRASRNNRNEKLDAGKVVGC